MKGNTEEDLLGITFDQSLSFKKHVKALCKKANQKLYALARISLYMNTEKLQRLMRAFVLSHFSYCPLVWMFHDTAMNHRINHSHEMHCVLHTKTTRMILVFSWSNQNIGPNPCKKFTVAHDRNLKSKIRSESTIHEGNFHATKH